jgi:Nuclear fragile X mental retardation-interacting protein 1 (NUFIP1)
MMASQKWIYDPPPPPPPKKTGEDGVRQNDGQGRGHGRGRSGWNKRGQARHQSQRKSNHGQGRQQQWHQQQLNANMAFPFMPVQTGFFSSYPVFQPPTMGFATIQSPPVHPPYPTPHQYPQQHSVAQPPPQQHTVQKTLPDTRKLLVYQAQPPLQNGYGYSMSSTAYSLPSHHFEPQPEIPVELSEEEIRVALEKSRAKNMSRYLEHSDIGADWGSIPIEGTSILLDTVEDVVAWRDERKKKWLSKIAARVWLMATDLD